MTLVLLGQLKAVSGKGMLVSFIDLKKAYDRVDRGKLWGCLKGMGIGGWALAFLKAAYSDVSCEVKVGAGRSDPFEVSWFEARVHSVSSVILTFHQLNSRKVEGG